MKAQERILKNVSWLFLIVFLATAGWLNARTLSVNKSSPIFMAEEVIVSKTAQAQPAVREASKPSVPPTTPLPLIPPRLEFKVLPVYPQNALQQGWGGTTVLAVYVGLLGQPERVETKVSSGIESLDQAAVAAVNQWKFSPATLGGQAVASWYEVPVRFAVQ